MAEPDEIIHQPLRLKIMAALWARRRKEPVEFTELKRIVSATDGNLGSHLATLEKAGYLRILKDHVGKRPRTRTVLTPEGARAFRGHVEFLRRVVDDADL
jgi:DNA-binding MarR family transcriptional regulator